MAKPVTATSNTIFIFITFLIDYACKALHSIQKNKWLKYIAGFFL